MLNSQPLFSSAICSLRCSIFFLSLRQVDDLFGVGEGQGQPSTHTTLIAHTTGWALAMAMAMGACFWGDVPQYCNCARDTARPAEAAALRRGPGMGAVQQPAGGALLAHCGVPDISHLNQLQYGPRLLFKTPRRGKGGCSPTPGFFEPLLQTHLP